jgi:hypothetical protein
VRWLRRQKIHLGISQLTFDPYFEQPGDRQLPHSSGKATHPMLFHWSSIEASEQSGWSTFSRLKTGSQAGLLKAV